MDKLYVLVSTERDNPTKVHAVYESAQDAIRDAVIVANVGVHPVQKDGKFQGRWEVRVPDIKVEVLESSLVTDDTNKPV